MDERIGIQARPPDRPVGPGRGRDLPSGLSQGEKHQASDRDLPSSHPLSTKCPTTDHASAAPNTLSLGAAPFAGAPITRVSCPAQPVGFVCRPQREEVAAPTCPLGHPVERLHLSGRPPSYSYLQLPGGNQ